MGARQTAGGCTDLCHLLAYAGTLVVRRLESNRRFRNRALMRHFRKEIKGESGGNRCGGKIDRVVPHRDLDRGE